MQAFSATHPISYLLSTHAQKKTLPVFPKGCISADFNVAQGGSRGGWQVPGLTAEHCAGSQDALLAKEVSVWNPFLTGW